MTIDRETIEALGDDEALRAEARRLYVAGDPSMMERHELVDAIAMRLAAVDDPSSMGWAMRTWRKTPPTEAQSDVFIDRGHPIPDRYWGGHWLRASIRDPRVLHVYWETDHDAADGWHVAAHGGDQTLAHFSTAPCTVGSGFLVLDDVRAAARVVLSRRRGAELEMVLEVEIVTAPLEHVDRERWIDVRTSTEANAPSGGRVAGTSRSRSLPSSRPAGTSDLFSPSSTSR